MQSAIEQLSNIFSKRDSVEMMEVKEQHESARAEVANEVFQPKKC